MEETNKAERTQDGWVNGPWTLNSLEPQQNGEQRWSFGKNGPRAYLTCDEQTALMILNSVAAIWD